MSGTWKIGETKERPGVYRRSENAGGVEIAGAAESVGLAVVAGTWGPLNTPVRTEIGDDVASVIGSGKGANVITELRAGGVNEIVVVRVGSGGKAAEITLKDGADTSVVTLTTLYPTSREFTLSVKESLDDETLKQAVIHEGTKTLETVSFAAGEGEVDGIITAFANSSYVTAKKVAAGDGTIAVVSQQAFTAGADPTADVEAYGGGFEASEEESWDGVAVDSEDPAVHALLHAFITRKFEEGEYPYTCVSEPKSVNLETRMQHAAAFNDEKMHYVLNSWTAADGTVYEGYLAAARIAGMIIASPSNESLTHVVITGAVSLNEKLKNAQIIKALRSGCLVLTLSKSRQVWIEKAINTLVTLSGDQDAGWKKIRRMKTRYELMNRVDATVEPMVGPVDNDDDGRAAVISAIQDVINAMAGEKKIAPGGTAYLDSKNPPKGDSAWFLIAVDDVDSLEHIYLVYRFRFAPEIEEE
ncbi:MAG: phage tail sheath subtilisin-like domain-containing protein [Eubacteriales bacterium]|nr:phage tail sheath subtilisin-like domain-containing protein [Eubacteriales bacterium]